MPTARNDSLGATGTRKLLKPAEMGVSPNTVQANTTSEVDTKRDEQPPGFAVLRSWLTEHQENNLDSDTKPPPQNFRLGPLLPSLSAPVLFSLPCAEGMRFNYLP